MTKPKEAQLDLLLKISEGLTKRSYEVLQVSPTDAIHAPSCGLAIRDAVDELRWMRAEIEKLRADRRERIATAALQGLLAYPETQGTVIDFAQMSVRYTDALIAELDKEANL